MERFSTYYDIKLQNMEKRPSCFPLITICLPFSTYCDIKGVNMENKPEFRPNPHLQSMGRIRKTLQYQRPVYRTELTCCQWILRYIHYFGGKPHPRLLGAKNIEAFLSPLAT
jgi:hypothetical protein